MDSPTPPHARWQRPVLMLLAVLTVAGLAWLLMDNPTTASRPRAAEAPPPTASRACEGAAEIVRAYRAPGQSLGLEAVVAMNLATDRRPTQIKDWRMDPAPAGDRCLVWMTASVGNADERFRWTYNLTTKRVEASDDATKRISGW